MADSDLVEGIHQMLRSATADAHRRVEHASGLALPPVSLNAYKGFLCATYRIVEPLESLLAHSVDWKSLGIDFEKRKRAKLLEADLRFVEVDEVLLGEVCPLPDVSSTAQALGALYVLEGSRLGGLVLAKQLISHYGAEKMTGATNYLRGNANNTAAEWKALLQQLHDYSATRPEDQSSIVAAAVETFECFEHSFKQSVLDGELRELDNKTGVRVTGIECK